MDSTEDVNRRYAGIERWSDMEILDALHDGQMRAVVSARQAIGAIAAAAGSLAERLREGGRLVYTGAGSSAGIVVLDGSELPGTFGVDRNQLHFLIAGGSPSLTDIDNGAEDDADAAAREIDALHIECRDSLIAVSASGATPYTLAAAQRAKRQGALVIGIANNTAAPLLQLADCPILLESGHEVVAGSTRLGAGTAQKVALNMLSTLTHIKLGCVLDGMMVGLKADNAKLRRRAIEIVARISGADETRATAALDLAGGDVKPAVLLSAGVPNLATARHMLAGTHGDLRRALDALAQTG